MTMYATLEEAIDAAREEFLADNPVLRKKMLTCNNSISKSMSCRTAILCGRPNFLPMTVKRENVCRY